MENSIANTNAYGRTTIKTTDGEEKKEMSWKSKMTTFQTDQAIPVQAHESHKRKRDDQSIQKSLNGSTKSMGQL